MNTVVSPLDDLKCIKCSGPKQRMMVLTMTAGGVMPSMLIAYAICAACDDEHASAAALDALRTVVHGATA